ncbi:methionyl-tRNA formyltransferase [Actinoplanes solisilvae]|uniref:methionyl-tRNA formyltransferase n=1 Tax=Actinoplanes solisilvae TaxID=2486853 RepID=UPI000FDBD906|nr:formyltransferase family protein [Actinoplanes solisilvae]
MLRVVLLTMYDVNYRVASNWAARNGHEIVLVGTLPRSASALAAALPPTAHLLSTSQLTTVAPPIIAATAPDLLISMGYSRLLPAEILNLPKYGAVNVHPSALPAGRGPNPTRLLYDGATELGATLHRTDAQFDTGAILSQRTRPLPLDLTGEAVFYAWLEMFDEILEEGVPRAVDGSPGLPQDNTLSSYAAPFADEERTLDLSEPLAVIRRKTVALNVLGATARVNLPEPTVISRVDVVPTTALDAAPGTILLTHHDGWTVRAGEGALRLTR